MRQDDEYKEALFRFKTKMFHFNDFDTKWHLRFIELARVVASWSKDPSTKCGAVITRPDQTVCSVGYNGFPKGMIDDKSIYEDREEKYRRVIHAELNAIFNSRDTNLNGYSIYITPGLSCDRCSVNLIQNEFKEVIIDMNNFYRDYHTKSIKYLFEANIPIISIDKINKEVYVTSKN